MSTIDPEDVARFSRIAEEWWDAEGKFKPLHRINPLRVGYIQDLVAAQFGKDGLKGRTLLDVGCGGGLIAEPMARLGAKVSAIDASDKNIAVATLHAEQSGLMINYQVATAEAQAESGAQYDMVLALEIVEHVADVGLFIQSCAQMVKPGGLLVLSTLNRTAKSYALAIIGAEYVLRWLPRGTHRWQQFLRPSELVAQVSQHGLRLHDMTGMVMHPLTFQWRLEPKDLSVNYLLAAVKPA